MSPLAPARATYGGQITGELTRDCIGLKSGRAVRVCRQFPPALARFAFARARIQESQPTLRDIVPMPAALDGITAVEFVSNLPAAYAAMMLAEHGARVVLAVPVGRAARLQTPQRRTFDRDKQTLVLDLDTPEGREQRDALLAGADVAITGDTPARCRAVGVDYPSIQRVNPAVIGLYLPPFGSAAPLADLEGGEELAAALSGVTGSQWARSGDPVATIFPVVSYATGVLGAIAATAALLARDRAGVGQAVEVPMIAGGLALQTGAALRH